MNYYRFPEKPVTKLCMFLILLALQVVARSTMFTSTLIGFGKCQVLMLALVAVSGIAFLLYNRKQLRQILTDRRMLALGIAAVLIFVPMLVKRDWQALYVTIFLGWAFAIFLTYFTTVEELGKYYVVLMTALGAASLVGTFVLKPLALAGVLPAHYFLSTGGWTMLNFGVTFVSVMNEDMLETFRAFGIFREPGLFQIFLFVAIELNNDWVEWKKPWQMWAVDAVLFAAMLVTFATGGVLALGIYLVFLFFDKGLYRNKTMRIGAAALVLLGAAAVAAALAQGGSWSVELIGMVDKITSRTDSYTSRLDSLAANGRMFLAHPIFGGKLSEVVYATANNTTTSPIIFAGFGLITGLVHVLSWAALSWKKERSLLLNLILLGILFVPFNTQNVIYDMFFWMFPVMALTQRGLPELEKIRRGKRG